MVQHLEAKWRERVATDSSAFFVIDNCGSHVAGILWQRINIQLRRRTFDKRWCPKKCETTNIIRTVMGGRTMVEQLNAAMTECMFKSKKVPLLDVSSKGTGRIPGRTCVIQNTGIVRVLICQPMV